MNKYAFAMVGLMLASSCASRHPPGVVDESYIHRYGVEVPSDEWKVRGESGVVVTKMKNGVVVTKSYDLGILQGESTYTYPHNSTIEKKEIYDGGILVSEMHFDLLGIPEKEIVYQGQGAKTIRTWYQNGTPKDEELYYGDKLQRGLYFSDSGQVASKVEDGEGIRLQRSRKGELTSKEKYESGEMVMRTKLYPNGSPEEIATFAGGKMHGYRKTFLPEGEPVSLEEWCNGQQHGMTIVFQAGAKIAEIPYVAGNKHGVERRFRDEEILVQEISWVNGVMQGPSRSYFGDTMTTEWYFQDRHVTKPSYDLLTRPSLQ